MKHAIYVLGLAFIFALPSVVQAGAEIVGSPSPALAKAAVDKSAPLPGCSLDCPHKKELELAKVEIDRLNALLAEKEALLKNKDSELMDKDSQIKALQEEIGRLKQSPLPQETAKGGIPSWLPWLIALLAALVAFVIGRSSSGGSAK